MLIHDRKSRLPLSMTGLVLMLSCTACIAASDSASNGIAVDLYGTGVQLSATDPVTEEGKISRASDRNRSTGPATPAAAATGNTNETGNGDTALLLDWHSDANNIYGVILPGEPLHPQK